MFKDGRTSVQHESRFRRTATCQIDQVIAKVYAAVMRDRRETIREIAEEVTITTFSAYYIMTEALTFLTKHQTPVVQQASYFPDMAPCDFWQLTKFKRPLKGTRFQTREDIMAATKAELNSIPKEAFPKCFQQWRHRWEKCVESQGDFEGD
ncbi:hypothetical protein CBL_05372 [Carabus blaptoides fortunei]